MEIRWYGKNSFVIKEGSVRVVIDPSEELVPSLNNDDLVITTQKNAEGIKSKVFDWPGEFETKGVLVSSLATRLGEDEQRVLSFEIEGIRICNLSSISEPISDNYIAEMGNVDILIVPMTLKVKHALELIEEIDPKLVSPSMQGEADTTLLADFLKEVGQAGLAEEEKIVIKNKSELDTDNIAYKILTKSSV